MGWGRSVCGGKGGGVFEARMMVQFLISENIEGGFRWIIDRSISKCEFLFAEASEHTTN